MKKHYYKKVIFFLIMIFYEVDYLKQELSKIITNIIVTVSQYK